MKVCAVVLRGYVNGYGIIRELHKCGVSNIAIIENEPCIGGKSNKISHRLRIPKTTIALKNALIQLHQHYTYLILFPTEDLQLEQLHQIQNDIESFCFLPFNTQNILDTLNKANQYKACEEVGIPYPKTVSLETSVDIPKLAELTLPIIIKPSARQDIYTNIFRNRVCHTNEDINKEISILEAALENGTFFIASELVPGDDTNIYAYVAYRSKKGQILAEWAGKKLTQHPDCFGVFSSASNEAPNIIAEQGRKLLQNMDLMGICEPEFKYDYRDKTYKLMEINMRSMMWHRLGNLSNVTLQYTQYLDAIGKPTPEQHQNKQDKIHLVYMKHEFLNLLTRPKYWSHFKYNVFGTKHRYFCVFDPHDIKPFLFDCISLAKGVILVWLKQLGLR